MNILLKKFQTFPFSSGCLGSENVGLQAIGYKRTATSLPLPRISLTVKKKHSVNIRYKILKALGITGVYRSLAWQMPCCLHIKGKKVGDFEAADKLERQISCS